MSIDPHPNLIEHGRKLLDIPDLRGRLRYYNDNICSLSFAYARPAAGNPYERSGLWSYGAVRGDDRGSGEQFFKLEGAKEEDISIYFEERQREVDRLKGLIGKSETYGDRLKIFLESRAGHHPFDSDFSFESDSFRVMSNEFQSYLAGVVKNYSSENMYTIDLWPSGYGESENRDFNQYIISYIQEAQKAPEKLHWLYVPRYRVFDEVTESEDLIGEMERALDKDTPRRNRIKEMEQRYRANSFIDFKSYLYRGTWPNNRHGSLLSLENDTWAAALFNAFLSGAEYDFGKNILKPKEVELFIFTKKTQDYYRLISDQHFSSSAKSAHFESRSKPSETHESETIFELLNLQDQDLIEKLRYIINGAKGKKLVYIVYALYQMGKLPLNPRNINQEQYFKLLKKEGATGTRQSFNKGFNSLNTGSRKDDVNIKSIMSELS